MAGGWMRRWRVHRWTQLAGNGESQMLCQFDDNPLGGSIDVCDAKTTKLPALAGSALGVPPLPVAAGMEDEEAGGPPFPSLFFGALYDRGGPPFPFFRRRFS